MTFNNSLILKRPSLFFRMISFLLLFSVSIVANAGVPDVAAMLMNFTVVVPDFMRLVTASAYVFGMWIVVQGIMELKQYGEQRTQYSSHASLKGPLIQFSVGTALLYLPSTVAVGLNTFWSEPAPYAYLNESTEQWDLIMHAGFMVVQLIGTISFIRGLLIMSKLGGSGSQHDAFARGLTHLIAGSFCINLYDFLDAVNGTLGIL